MLNIEMVTDIDTFNIIFTINDIEPESYAKETRINPFLSDVRIVYVMKKIKPKFDEDDEPTYDDDGSSQIETFMSEHISSIKNNGKVIEFKNGHNKLILTKVPPRYYNFDRRYGGGH